MEFSIGRLYVKLELKQPGPFGMGRAVKRRLAERILMEAAGLDGSRKLARIKVLREIARDKDWPKRYSFGLKETKEWIEANFDDNGSGRFIG